jgi:ATPase family associated with various cellular activities (AAA)/AAA lid domain
MSTQTLGDAIAALAAAAQRAGLDPAVARSEGESLAAAVAEPATGAYGAWASELGRTPDATAFFAAASAGRRWRVSPTPLLSQLANTSAVGAADYAAALASVCTAATGLGEPNQHVVAAAMGASAAQLSAAPGATVPLTPSLSSPARPYLPAPGGSSLDLPGLDPELAKRLQASEDRLKAMDDFTLDGPSVLGGVLDQLKANADRIKALREGQLIVPPGGTAGSLPTDAPGITPMGQNPGAPVAGAPAPAQAQADPAAAPAEPDKPKEPEKTLEELLADLDGLVGLATVKAEIHRQTAILRVEALRQKAGLKVATITRHLVFVGNPGTGKTTVARLVGGIYRALGLLSKGQLIEVDRGDLVAGYLGQTAMKTEEVCKRALGGVLFIDEAYGLAGDQYGEEAINTLVKLMEDNRADLVVIVAGYPLPMETFISENPGLASRFRTTIVFDDYTDDELIGIFTGMVKAADYDLGDGALDAFTALLGRQVRNETFGNGRFARNVMEAAIGHQAWRLRSVEAPTVDQLRALTSDDVLGDATPEVVDWQAEDAALEEAQAAPAKEAQS